MSFDHDKAREICRGCLTNGWNPMTAALAEIERLERENERLREIWDELAAIKANYGDECDHMLTRDAIDLKQAINRIWEELERMCPGAMTALEGRE